MRKLLLATLLFAGAVNAQTYVCNTYTVYQGVGNGQYNKIDNSTPSFSTIIETSRDVIKVYVKGEESTYTEFWKDYNDYRNDTGLIKQSGNEFEIKTAIEDPTGTAYIPVKIEYHCK
ncbi:hypothetical protein FDH34_gp028 [Serratia phage BF]|uniref:Uncharacterized protein n=2 Tax=Eneladusvirus BF TaxID=2560751 RepID=A0A7L8ZNK2_9CAUD|nr:hypothetical protein FDH34_gp028 [Serratia phage BF]AQW88553.1 hypothetical protein BF_0028 [Serratia phage BF]QOI71511.1 hypothetical protein pEaSNUABM47_00027 [Erwinia phage pEa_SNUABM_47]QXO11722.1 hypothetical protein pEaSNUABM44_00026 [Erwinia phage pEa_SNUABM_44]QXO12273.1 hypothetical protein pEaSNUABM49_00027 [Erwinia phage pEa_SNUABM_49]